MLDKLIKVSLCLCMLVYGSAVFANSLNAVEIKTNSNNGKIILDTNKKFSINKSKISNNEIQIELKNTNIAENLTTQSNNSLEKGSVSIIQNGKNTYINIKGNNASKYDIVFAGDNSSVPQNSKSKNILFSVAIMMLAVVASRIFNEIKEFITNRKEKLRKEFGFESTKQEKLSIHKKQLGNIKSLRAKVESPSNISIHTQSMPRFATNTTMSTPKDLKISNTNIFNIKELKKAANL